ncbi:hypothetical protein V6N13_038711 [Hibiscus sabdariffa]
MQPHARTLPLPSRLHAPSCHPLSRGFTRCRHVVGVKPSDHEDAYTVGSIQASSHPTVLLSHRTVSVRPLIRGVILSENSQKKGSVHDLIVF